MDEILCNRKAEVIGVHKWFTGDELKRLSTEIQEIKDKNYDIGDVSDFMKSAVRKAYGALADDLSTSGYWVRAEGIILSQVQEVTDKFYETYPNLKKWKGK